MTDKEIADKYRAAIAQTYRLYVLLTGRGYKITINGKSVHASDYSPSDNITICKVETISV